MQKSTQHIPMWLCGPSSPVDWGYPETGQRKLGKKPAPAPAQSSKQYVRESRSASYDPLSY